jgi:hypothetical protein
MHARFVRFMSLVVGVALLGLLTGSPVQAQAATTPPPKAPLEADLKGVVGLGLIGAELGLVLPAVAGLEEVWSLILFPVLGGAGGAAAGYFAIEKGNHAELAVASLTLGMALVIPAVILTASALAYDPSEDRAQADPATLAARAASAQARARDPRLAGTGLVRVAEGGVAVSAPAVVVLPEATSHGFELSEVQFSVLSGRF